MTILTVRPGNPGQAQYGSYNGNYLQSSGGPWTGADEVYGSYENDRLQGYGGADFLSGGDGNDIIFGSYDSIYFRDQFPPPANDGNDSLWGGGGDDYLDGQDANDELHGGTGNDDLFGGAGNDTIFGDDGDDTLYGGDYFIENSGNDALYGGDGDDSFVSGSGTNIVDGGNGQDTLFFELDAQPATVNLDIGIATISGYSSDTVTSIEEVYGTNSGDYIYGNIYDNTLSGRGGWDLLDGGGGLDTAVFVGDRIHYSIEFGADDTIIITDNRDPNQINQDSSHNKVSDGKDTVSNIEFFRFKDRIYTFSELVYGSTDGPDYLYGSFGVDRIDGQGGDDVIYGFEGDDILNGGDGDDWIEGGSGSNTISGGDGDDWIDSDSGSNTISGGDGDDWINGAYGSNTISGGDGDDWIEGGSGSNTISGGNGVDTVSYAFSGNLDANLATGVVGFLGNSTSVDQLYTIENIIAGGGDDVVRGDFVANSLSGSDGDDRLYGEAGEDRVAGGRGDDRLYGGDDNDRLFGGSGTDWLSGEAGDDRLAGAAGTDRLYGGDGNDRMFGNSGDDRLSGGDGDDWVAGGTGSDRLFGSDGDDFLYGEASNDILSGGNGNDLLVGGPGTDQLTGGRGRDIFLFASEADVGRLASRDVILDFASRWDIIDISGIDANTRRGGNQGFTYIAGDDFSNRAGELRLFNGVLLADTDGNGYSDFQIEVEGRLRSTDLLL